MSTEKYFEKLNETLFGGTVKAADFKTLGGFHPDTNRESMAKELLESMARVGITRDGELLDVNNS
ncbi:hypothetical protein [Parasphingorhabdus sp.]